MTGRLFKSSLSEKFRLGIRRSHAQTQLKSILDAELNNIQLAGTWKEERIITSKQDVNISIKNAENQVLNFCANNYLGLSSHPSVIEAGKSALQKYGAGLSSVRFICGTQDIHMELEELISKYHGREATILFASCFDANAGFFETILNSEDAVLSDELNHASIIDGIRLCKAQRRRYLHRNMDDLEKQLIETKDLRMRMIVTDGVFSMDGNVTPLDKICDLATKHNALVFVDDCHATGFFGKTGRGTEEYFNLGLSKVDVINSTLGKALGGASGGYTTGSKEVVALLRQRARPYLFSNSLPPPVVACAIKVFQLLLADSGYAERIQENTVRFRSKMTEIGYKISGDNHPICPVMIGDAKLAGILANEMLAQGIYVVAFSYPVVPKGSARIRVQISASHTMDQIDQTVDAFRKLGKNLKII